MEIVFLIGFVLVYLAGIVICYHQYLKSDGPKYPIGCLLILAWPFMIFRDQGGYRR